MADSRSVERASVVVDPRGIGTDRGVSAQHSGPARQALRVTLFAEDSRCFWCRFPMGPPSGETPTYATATLDHIKPVSHGGTNDPENLVLACRSCNAARGQLLAEQWCEMVDKKFAGWSGMPPERRGPLLPWVRKHLGAERAAWLWTVSGGQARERNRRTGGLIR